MKIPTDEEIAAALEQIVNRPRQLSDEETVRLLAAGDRFLESGALDVAVVARILGMDRGDEHSMLSLATALKAAFGAGFVCGLRLAEKKP